MNIIVPEFVNEDARRKLTTILSANIKQINCYECAPGVTLGGHYHDKTSEYFYVISGELKIGNEFASSSVKPGEVYAVYPKENHIVEVVGHTKFLTFLTNAFDEKNPDLHNG